MDNIYAYIAGFLLLVGLLLVIIIFSAFPILALIVFIGAVGFSLRNSKK